MANSLSIVADENMAGVQEYFSDIGQVRLVNGRSLGNSELHDADVLLVRSVTQVNKALLDSTPVQFVGTATSGFDHIDRPYLQQRGVSFSHAPGSNANSVVEYVLGVIAALDNKLEALFDGGTLGIVGYGNIGSLLGCRLDALGIAYKVYDPWLEQSTVRNSCAMPDILKCNVISLHAELTQKNPWPSVHLIGEAELAQMNAGTLLINASRGAVLDNVALEKCLLGGKRISAVVDVWEGEPQLRESLLPLVRIGTAHIAGYSHDGKLLATKMLKNALLRHLARSVPEATPAANSGAPLIRLNEVPQNKAGFLRSLMQQHYCPIEDDHLLREATLGKAAAEAAANFDQLRKTYKIRREVFGSTVELESANTDQRGILEAMACQLVNIHRANA